VRFFWEFLQISGFSCEEYYPSTQELTNKKQKGHRCTELVYIRTHCWLTWVNMISGFRASHFAN